MMAKATKPEVWRNRIVESAEVAASELMANPRNARKHPPSQRAALKGVLNEVGWVGRVIVNRTTGLLIDGHLRVEEAAKRKETIPVDFVDLTPAEEAMMLALYDPIGAMAETDQAMLDELMAAIETTDEALLELIAGLTSEGFVEDDPSPQIENTRWEVIVICGDETEQAEVLELLESQGRTVKAVVA